MAAGNPSTRPSASSLLALCPPFPVVVLQPLFRRIVAKVIRNRPQIFQRLGPHRGKRFLIDPTNLPFAVALQPGPGRASLKAVHRGRTGCYDARIAGTFLTLLDMVDGRLDGDALFFSRDLQVTGDTEAVVSLRNALDDLEGSVADDVAAVFGPPGRIALQQLRSLRRRAHAC